MDDFRKIEAERLPNAKPMGDVPLMGFIMIDKLVIDDRYQRELTETGRRQIVRIAQAFDWAKFTAVDVAAVPGRRYAIIDGQHRVHAALAVGIDRVPCRISNLSPSQQAAAFAAINGQVTAVTIWNIYRAALVAGDAWAIASRDVCESAGCELMTCNASTAHKKPGEIYAVGFIKNQIDTGQQDSLIVALKALKRSWRGRNAELWSHRPLRAWCASVRQFPEIWQAEAPDVAANKMATAWMISRFWTSST